MNMEWIMMKSLLQILKWHLFIAYYYGFIRRWQLSQINVRNVFLNSDHKEEIYMQYLSRLCSDHENQVVDCIMLYMSLRRHHMLLWFFFFFFFFFFLCKALMLQFSTFNALIKEFCCCFSTCMIWWLWEII